jgi:hypothetical protein
MNKPDKLTEEQWAALKELWAKFNSKPQPKQPTQG